MIVQCALCGEWKDSGWTYPVERPDGSTPLHVCVQKRFCMIRTIEKMQDAAALRTVHTALLSTLPQDA